MSKKVLNMIEFFYLIIIGFVGFCLYQNIPSTIFWLSVGVGIFTFILFNIHFFIFVLCASVSLCTLYFWDF